jgi:hypothetical protein
LRRACSPDWTPNFRTPSHAPGISQGRQSDCVFRRC